MSDAPPAASSSAPAITLTAFVAAVLLILALGGAHVLGDALRAAGEFQDVAPIRGVGRFVEAIKSNLLWLAITVAGLCIVALGLLFMFGHSRASDIATRVAFGFGLVVAGGGIAA